jgi:hypothetical protein
MRRYAVVLVATLALLAGSGCGETPTARPAEEDTVGDDAGTSRSGPPSASGRTGVTADAVRDLSRRLDLAPEQITVVSAEEVTWRDGSIGCPQPGMMYTQSLTDGSRVVLEAGGRRYEYHAGGRRPAFLCENPETPARR